MLKYSLDNNYEIIKFEVRVLPFIDKCGLTYCKWQEEYIIVKQNMKYI